MRSRVVNTFSLDRHVFLLFVIEDMYLRHSHIDDSRWDLLLEVTH